MSDVTVTLTQEDATAVWWLGQDDMELLGDEAPEGLPEYIRREYRDRLGRAGRGRLWIAAGESELAGAAVDPWPDTPTAKHLGGYKDERFFPPYIGSYGGIVIHARHAPLLAYLPGVVTDMRLNYWHATPAQPGPLERLEAWLIESDPPVFIELWAKRDSDSGNGNVATCIIADDTEPDAYPVVAHAPTLAAAIEAALKQVEVQA
jgi:hypothetical protein